MKDFCEHGFYQSRGCSMCAALVAKFKDILFRPRCRCIDFEPSENPERCPVHGSAEHHYDCADNMARWGSKCDCGVEESK